MSDSSSSQTPFLGGGPKFNQAGNNAPLPGEHRVEAPPPPPFGGPRVWIGCVVLVALLVMLFLVYGGGMAGVPNPNNSRPGVSPSDKPPLDPDSSQ